MAAEIDKEIEYVVYAYAASVKFQALEACPHTATLGTYKENLKPS